MKQNVSAPVALIAIGLCAGLAFVVFSRPKHQTVGQDDVFLLPFAPSVEEQEVGALRQAVYPLGVSVVFPPLPGDRSAGTRIALVAPGSPGATGGLQPGDLVLSFNGLQITHPFALASAVSRAEPEKPIEIVVERAGEKQTLIVPSIKKIQSKEQLF